MARPTSTSPYGKCDARLDVPVPSELKDAVAAIAFLHGVTVSEYVREVLEDHIHGKAARMKRYAQRGNRSMGGTLDE